MNGIATQGDFSVETTAALLLEWERRSLAPQRLLTWKGAAGTCPTPLQSQPLPLGGKADAPIVYWRHTARRQRSNASLAAATLLAHLTGRSLLVVETLQPQSPWDSKRHIRFLLGGVEERLAATPHSLFLPLVHPHDTDVLCSLLAQAALVVADWTPVMNGPTLISDVIKNSVMVSKTLLLVDDLGIVPLAAHPKPEYAARFLRPKLASWIEKAPLEEKGIAALLRLPVGHVAAFPVQHPSLFGKAQAKPSPDLSIEKLLSAFTFSTKVSSVPLSSREREAHRVWKNFHSAGIAHYAEQRMHPDANGSSHLSPYLRAGALHPRQIVTDIFKTTGASSLSDMPEGSSMRTFLDELLTWRELGLNMAHFAFHEGIALGDIALVPEWARKSLTNSLVLRSEAPLDLATLESAASPDPIWNAAQQELLTTGVVHNYMRMLWGKGVVRWSRNPQEALSRLEYLNNKYAIDGCDANSYLGFLWCLGKFDRPWPPARAPFGLVRSMTTKNARKKVQMEEYLKRFAP